MELLHFYSQRRAGHLSFISAMRGAEFTISLHLTINGVLHMSFFFWSTICLNWSIISSLCVSSVSLVSPDGYFPLWSLLMAPIVDAAPSGLVLLSSQPIFYTCPAQFFFFCLFCRSWSLKLFFQHSYSVWKAILWHIGVCSQEQVSAALQHLWIGHALIQY